MQRYRRVAFNFQAKKPLQQLLPVKQARCCCITYFQNITLVIEYYFVMTFSPKTFFN